MRCPRCRAKLAREDDQYGERIYCLMCGYDGETRPAPDEEALGETYDFRTGEWREKQRRRRPSHSGVKL